VTAPPHDSVRQTLPQPLRIEQPLRFLKFCVVGASGVVINQLTLWLAREYLFAAVATPRLRLNASLAVAISLATLNNFLWNRFWTWSDRHSGSDAATLARQLGQYVLAVSLGIGVQALLTNLLATFMHYLLANLIAIGVASGANFAVNNAWTFRVRAAAPPQPS
jgi:putative flippase GtrA